MIRNVIDTHAHLWTEEYLDLLESGGLEGTAIAKGLNALDTPEDMVKRLKMMDDANVSYQVLSVTPQSPYISDGEKANEAAMMINDRYYEII